jgi:hypothetical protein
MTRHIKNLVVHGIAEEESDAKEHNAFQGRTHCIEREPRHLAMKALSDNRQTEKEPASDQNNPNCQIACAYQFVHRPQNLSFFSATS